MLPRLPSSPKSLLAATLETFWTVVPFCITAPLGKTRRSLPRATPTSYINGLRGVACLIVFNQHVLYLLCPWSLRAYGAPDVTKNVLQMPIVRVVYAGDGMVALFFVLSGYVLAYSPLRMIHAGTPADEFLTKLSSSVLRRGIRLFTPMLAFGLMTAVLTWVLPWYEAPKAMNRWRQDDDSSLSAFFKHLSRFAVDALSGMDPFDFSWANGEPEGWSHCWTIPHQYRGSLAVYMACLATCRLTPTIRKAMFLGLALWVICSPRHYWEMSCFFSGLLLAETRIPSTSNSLQPQPCKPWTKHFSIAIRTLALIVSTVFLGWPVWGSTTQQPYVLLRRVIIPETWASDGFYEGDHSRRYLYSIGAVLMFWALEGLPWAKRLLSRPELIYLGEIGYSFFLLHWMVLYSYGRYLYSYLHYIDAYSRNGPLVVYFSTLAISIIVADLFWRAVDEGGIKLAKFLVQVCLKVGDEGRLKIDMNTEQPHGDEAIQYGRSR
ncbi:putative acyltransferase protein [Seiridium unicorne]|uniref:Acyltransferase protein n=1 Tax=Seiridium unicorne TaxID=138068 RepID=A0ABR2UUV6_9PEZI